VIFGGVIAAKPKEALPRSRFILSGCLLARCSHYQPMLGLVITISFLQPVTLSFSEVERAFTMRAARIIQRELFQTMQNH
jgi:hypothetical protein